MDFKNIISSSLLILLLPLSLTAQQRVRLGQPIPLENRTISVDINAARNFDASQISQESLNNIAEVLREQTQQQITSEAEVNAFIGELIHNREIGIGFFSLPTIDLFKSLCSDQSVHIRANEGIERICEVVKSSDVCQSIPQDDRLNCDELRAGAKRNPFEFLQGCTTGLFDSATEMLSFAMQALETIFHAVFNPIDTTSETITETTEYFRSTKLYLTNEFDKAYEEASPPFRRTKAAGQMLYSISSLLINNIQQFLTNHYQEFGCLNFRARMEAVCLVASEVLIPPASALALLKYGSKAIKSSSKVNAFIARQKQRFNITPQIKKLAENSLNRQLTDQEVASVEEAHLIGRGEVGKDGTPARIGNYTLAQLRRKAGVLKDAGFSSEEIRKLMENGVVGLSQTEVLGLVARIGQAIRGQPQILPRTGNPNYDGFRDAFESNDFSGDNQYISFVTDDDQRIVGKVVSSDRNRRQVVIEDIEGNSWNVDGNELNDIRLSDSSRTVFQRRLPSIPRPNNRRDERRNRFRQEVWDRKDFSGDNQYISFVNRPGQRPSSARITKIEDNRLIAEDVNGNVIVLEEDDLLNVAQSDTAKELFTRRERVRSPPTAPRGPPGQYQFSSRAVSHYESRNGKQVVEVNLNSNSLQRWMGQATDLITERTGIRPRPGRQLTDTEKNRIYQTWLNDIVPLVEDPNRHDDRIYGRRRNRVIGCHSNGRADLGELLDNQSAVCRELSIFGSVLFGEYGIRSRVVTGSVGTGLRRQRRGNRVIELANPRGGGGHAWIQVYDRNNNPVEIIDSNNTQRVHPNYHEYNQQQEGAHIIRETQIVEPQ